jgi:hypothetical protein
MLALSTLTQSGKNLTLLAAGKSKIRYLYSRILLRSSQNATQSSKFSLGLRGLQCPTERSSIHMWRSFSPKSLPEEESVLGTVYFSLFS